MTLQRRAALQRRAVSRPEQFGEHVPRREQGRPGAPYFYDCPICHREVLRTTVATTGQTLLLVADPVGPYVATPRATLARPDSAPDRRYAVHSHGDA